MEQEMKYIKNLEDQLLTEGLASDAAEISGVDSDIVDKAVNELDFAAYLELGNAVETEDADRIREILNVGDVVPAEPIGEIDLEEDDEHPEDQSPHDSTILCSDCKGQGYDEYGDTCISCGGKGRLTLSGEYIDDDAFELAYGYDKIIRESADRKFYVSGMQNKRGRYRITGITRDDRGVYDVQLGKSGKNYVWYDPNNGHRLIFTDNQGKPMTAQWIFNAMNAGKLREAETKSTYTVTFNNGKSRNVKAKNRDEAKRKAVASVDGANPGGSILIIGVKSIKKLKEADNPSAPAKASPAAQAVIPPSAGSSINALAQPADTATDVDDQEVQQGRKEVDDLQIGDEIEVADIDGQLAAGRVRNLAGPGDTLVITGKGNEEHMIRKDSILSTPLIPVQEKKQSRLDKTNLGKKNKRAERVEDKKKKDVYEIDTDAMREAYENTLNGMPNLDRYWVYINRPDVDYIMYHIPRSQAKEGEPRFLKVDKATGDWQTQNWKANNEPAVEQGGGSGPHSIEEGKLRKRGTAKSRPAIIVANAAIKVAHWFKQENADLDSNDVDDAISLETGQEDMQDFINISKLIRAGKLKAAAKIFDNLDSIVEEELQGVLSDTTLRTIDKFIKAHGGDGFYRINVYDESLEEGEDRIDHREIIDMITPHASADDMAEDLLPLIQYAFDDLEIEFDVDLANKVLMDLGREPIAEGLSFFVDPLGNGKFNVMNSKGDIHDTYNDGIAARKSAEQLNAQYSEIDEDHQDIVNRQIKIGSTVTGPTGQSGEVHKFVTWGGRRRAKVRFYGSGASGQEFFYVNVDNNNRIMTNEDADLTRLKELAGLNEVKSGNFNSKMIGQRVEIMAVNSFGKNHIGEKGVVTRASREHTFSQLVPFIIEYGVELDSGERMSIRREGVRKIKQIADVREAIDPNYEYKVLRKSMGGEWEYNKGDKYPSLEKAKQIRDNMKKGATVRTKFKITRVARTKLSGPKHKLPETASGGSTGAGAIASSPVAMNGIQKRNPSIYGQTKLKKKPRPKTRLTKEDASEGIGRDKKD